MKPKGFYGILTKLICLTVIFCYSAGAVEYSETNEGYAQGFLPICPGSWKPAEIKPENLEKIKISVLGKGSVLQAKWTTYNHRTIKYLAKDPEIDFRRRTIVYCPGYLETIAFPVGRAMMTFYKRLGYNVLLLEYIAFTTNIFPIVARLMRPIGKHAAELLANLTTVGLNPKKLELVGLSLGGVAMTFVAKNFRQITGRNISVLTAIDPTGPCFRHLGPDQRLDPSDADFVLHIATNTGGYSIATPAGHVTVYVNGGEYQPGILPSVLCDNLCSHMQALFIWITALERPGSFIAMQCDSVQQARDHKCFDRNPRVTNTLDRFTDRTKPGIYYLATSPEYPFYLGKPGLNRRNAPYLNYITSLNDVEVLRFE